MKTTNRIPSIHVPNVALPDQALDAFQGARNAASSLEGLRGSSSDVFETSETPGISSLVEKYKGPDSLKRPEIESEVAKYKGPKQPFDERGSRVEKYKGPDSAQRQIFIVPEPDLDVAAAIRSAASSFSLFKDHEDK